MRRITAFLGLLLVFLFSSGCILAQEPVDLSAVRNPEGQENSPAVLPSLYNNAEDAVVNDFKLVDASTEVVDKIAPPHRH